MAQTRSLVATIALLDITAQQRQPLPFPAPQAGTPVLKVIRYALFAQLARHVLSLTSRQYYAQTTMPPTVSKVTTQLLELQVASQCMGLVIQGSTSIRTRVLWKSLVQRATLVIIASQPPHSVREATILRPARPNVLCVRLAGCVLPRILV